MELDFRVGFSAGDSERAFLEVGVNDAGRGFDPGSVRPPDLAEKLRSGRKRGWGIKIIESLMDDVRIESGARGTRIVMRKYR